MMLNPLSRGLRSFLRSRSRREEAQISQFLQTAEIKGQSLPTSVATNEVGVLKPALSVRTLAWWTQAQQHSPRWFTGGVLMVAVVLAIAHYTFGEWAVYPEVTLWKERVFWAAFPSMICVPILHWVGWTLVSLGRLKPAPVILGATIILCFGDLVWYLVWLNLQAVGLDYKKFFDYWDWWGYWPPGVLVVANLVMVRRWWKLFRPAIRREARRYTRSELILRVSAGFLAYYAVLITAVHLVLPRMAVNDFTLSMADLFLTEAEWKEDFNFVVQNSISRGKRLGAILEHAELANLQRRQFYKNLDQAIYQQFVLSPVVDHLPLSELDWRRTLWESFYPRVRNEHDPGLAAQTVVRFLRERVGIDSTYAYRVGVETIWTQQMTDEIGFERIYVAALRSVGIAARLDELNRAELWTGNAWQNAPRPVIASWSKSIEFSN